MGRGSRGPTAAGWFEEGVVAGRWWSPRSIPLASRLEQFRCLGWAQPGVASNRKQAAMGCDIKRDVTCDVADGVRGVAHVPAQCVAQHRPRCHAVWQSGSRTPALSNGDFSLDLAHPKGTIIAVCLGARVHLGPLNQSALRPLSTSQRCSPIERSTGRAHMAALPLRGHQRSRLLRSVIVLVER